MIPLTSPALSLIELDPSLPQPTALPDRIYAALKYRILTCAMPPAERIVEKGLCQELEISRTPLREALNRLVLEGLILLRPFRGFIVAPVTVEGFRELCELRRIMEGGTAALAADRAAPEDCSRLRDEARLQYTRGDRDTYVTCLQTNSRFHLALVRCTRNRLLEGIVMSALDRHQRPLYLGLGGGYNAETRSEEHMHIADAVGRRDAEAARGLMVEHISMAEHRIASALQAAGY